MRADIWKKAGATTAGCCKEGKEGNFQSSKMIWHGIIIAEVYGELVPNKPPPAQ